MVFYCQKIMIFQNENFLVWFTIFYHFSKWNFSRNTENIWASIHMNTHSYIQISPKCSQILRFSPKYSIFLTFQIYVYLHLKLLTSFHINFPHLSTFPHYLSTFINILTYFPHTFPHFQHSFPHSLTWLKYCYIYYNFVIFTIWYTS